MREALHRWRREAHPLPLLMLRNGRRYDVGDLDPPNPEDLDEDRPHDEGRLLRLRLRRQPPPDLDVEDSATTLGSSPTPPPSLHVARPISIQTDPPNPTTTSSDHPRGASPDDEGDAVHPAYVRWLAAWGWIVGFDHLTLRLPTEGTMKVGTDFNDEEVPSSLPMALLPHDALAVDVREWCQGGTERPCMLLVRPHYPPPHWIAGFGAVTRQLGLPLLLLYGRPRDHHAVVGRSQPPTQTTTSVMIRDNNAWPPLGILFRPTDGTSRRVHFNVTHDDGVIRLVLGEPGERGPIPRWLGDGDRGLVEANRVVVEK